MTTEAYHGYVPVQGRGTVTIPAALRRRLRLDEPGAQLELTERADGVVEMRGTLPIPVDQQWFWTDEWQQGERKVDAAFAAGKGVEFETAEEFVTWLNADDRA